MTPTAVIRSGIATSYGAKPAGAAGRRLPAMVMALLMIIAGAASTAFGEPRLRAKVTVTGEQVTLGDLFTETGALAGVKVSAAPAPGERGVLTLWQIARMARDNGLLWRGGEGFSRVLVKRASTVVPTSEVVRKISKALTEGGKRGLFSVHISNRRLKLHVPLGADTSITVENIQYGGDSNRFMASLYVPSAVSGKKRISVSGEVRDLLEIPVLANPVAAGTEITLNDLDWITMPANRVPRGVLTDAQTLVGFTPRRSVRLGRPIRANDIERPMLIKKGDIVKMIITHPRMIMSAMGRALRSGAKGETIQIMNLATKETVEAVIETAGQARVITQTHLVIARSR